MKSVSYVGLDVDTKSFSVAIFNPDSGTISEHRLRPRADQLVEFIRKLGTKVVICYEAGYLGFSLARKLINLGFQCQVVAPSLIPKFTGDKVKTDRLDAAKLAKFFAAGLLTTVQIPDENDEATRSLVRSRQFAVKQLTQVKNRITGFCRSRGWDFKDEKNVLCYWTTLHLQWLDEKIQTSDPIISINLDLLLKQYKELKSLVAQYENAILKICEDSQYIEKVKALTAYRSIDKMTAISIVTELGDIGRFDSPRRITSYVGLDITEYSSGGSHHRFQITRQGNAYLRYALVEATQYGLFKPNISKSLKKRRENIDPNFIEIADRAMDRMYRKGSRLLYAGKHKNKVKVAMARELIGFIWESLREAQKLPKNKILQGTVLTKKSKRQPTVGSISVTK